MTIFSDITEQDLINLRKLAEQQKNQRALKIKNRILKQTHERILAERLSPKTKKLDEVKDSTEKVGEIKEQLISVNNNIRAHPNSSSFSRSIREMLGSLLSSHTSLKNTQDRGYTNLLGVPIQISGVDTKKQMKISMN